MPDKQELIHHLKQDLAWQTLLRAVNGQVAVARIQLGSWKRLGGSRSGRKAG